MENRLCLKRTDEKDGSESIPKELSKCNIKHALDKVKMDEELQTNKISSNTLLVTEDNSILEFKSPDAKIIKPTFSDCTTSNILKHKSKTATKFKNCIKNHKDMKYKQDSEKRKHSRDSQLSIESSFFKSKDNCDSNDMTTDTKVALVCPLCFKIFKDLDSRILHMKFCASKNNISTKKLLDAIELQKRQEDERKSLGLLAAPIIPDKKKPVPSRINLNKDSDLELALALSKSLYDAEELDEISEIERLSEIPNQSVLEALESKRSLEKFGFANSKPISLIKSKRKKYNEVTILQTRSQEERNRILTERIAEILMGDEPVTQIQREKNDYSQEIKMKTILKSRLLQELYCKEDKIWDKARLTQSRKCFYVTNLSEYIFPQEKLIEVEEENAIKFTNVCKVDDVELNQNKIEKNKEENKLFGISQTDLCLTSKKHKNCKDKQYIDTLVINWGDALNDSSASDIIIFVNNDKYIWAHKLVFYVRCSNILIDVIPNDISQFIGIKERICWLDVSYNIALAFLEFIYCGIIKKYLSIFEDSTSFSSLRNLARKYKVEELFAYLQMKETEIEEPEIQIHDTKDIECGKIDEKSSPDSNILTSIAKNLHSQEIEINAYIDRSSEREVDCQSKINIIPLCNASPDMFDDTNDTILNYKERCTRRTSGFEETKNDNNLSILNSIDDSKITKSITYKNVEECIHSLSDTPHCNRSEQRNIKNFNTMKPKSNLSLFIEQFQKENAKSDFDTDSEITLISVSPKLNRNPFNMKQYDDSSRNSSLNRNAVVTEIFKEKQDVLSKFDSITNTSSTLNTEDTFEESDTNMHLSFESINNLTRSLEYNIGNSTKMYREKCIDNTENEIQNKVTFTTSENLLIRNANVENVNSIITAEACSPSESSESQDSIPSDLYPEEGEISMYSSYKKKHQNNSIVNYRDFVTKYILNNSVKNSLEECEYTRKSNTDSNDITVLSDIDVDTNFSTTPEIECINQTEEEQLVFNIEKSTQIPEKNVQNDSDKKYFPVCVTSPTSRESISNVRTNNSSELRCSIINNKLSTIDTTENGNRKFKKKSMSESNLNINVKDIKNNPCSKRNRSQCKCGRKRMLRTVMSPTIIGDNVTPLPNYNDMKTPELHAELCKYGLKIQKRDRAIKLLTHIYNELHPIICTIPTEIETEFAIISSDDEEPPKKKTNYNKTNDNYMDDYKYELQHSQESIVSTQLQFENLEPTITTDNTQNIKDVFSALIKVKRELHNNILTYEPLCIEALYSILKEEGFNCNINTLVNFLDEQVIFLFLNKIYHITKIFFQCITFYLRETRLNKNKNKQNLHKKKNI
ncbi:uncharacterized protein LOC128881019 isoform X1 [Hylaeus volcanicus]|uniref:uncharacterized protein LOC128881019 isoform X1 n=1 Tax=Hylaeus volcanicus TaxID=313075 RepID=UPI0023B82DBA|nr:uncharacterized protein LOC128881019 isoform X1 [Hylaeus volcanicus]XP_053987647.1 uncharacterized protein LOC128881019 isoform X1 [Hylaeus volcanicus]